MLRQIHGERQTKSHTYRQQYDAENGSNQHRCILPVYKETECDGKRNKQDGSRCNGTVACTSAVACADKGICHDIGKCRNNQKKYQPCEYGEQHTCLFADILLDYLAQG